MANNMNDNDSGNSLSRPRKRQSSLFNVTHNQNEEQPECTTALLFQPFKSLLTELINQNKQIREDINQLKDKTFMNQLMATSGKVDELQLHMNQLVEQKQLHSEEESRKHQDLQCKMNQLRKQNEKQLETLTQKFDEDSKKNREFRISTYSSHHNAILTKLVNIDNQYNQCVERCSEQRTRNDKLQTEIDHFKNQTFAEQLNTQLNKVKEMKRNGLISIAITFFTLLTICFILFPTQGSIQLNMDQVTKEINQLSKTNKEFQKQINQLTKKNSEYRTSIDELQNQINQLTKTQGEHETDINGLQTENQIEKIQILEITQQHNLLDESVLAIRKYIKYPYCKYM